MNHIAKITIYAFLVFSPNFCNALSDADELINFSASIEGGALVFTLTNNSEDTLIVNSDFAHKGELTHILVVDELSGWVFTDELEFIGRPSIEVTSLRSGNTISREFSLIEHYPKLLQDTGIGLIFWSTVISTSTKKGDIKSFRFSGSKKIKLPFSTVTKELRQGVEEAHSAQLDLYRINNMAKPK